MANKTKDPVKEPDTKTCCIEDWEEDLKDAQNDLKLKECTKSGLSSKSASATSWYGKLNLYWECLKTTEELLEEVSVQLDLFTGQSDMICRNIECSRRAIQILYCRIRKIFECTDALRQTLIDFMVKVDCLGDDNLNEKTSEIIRCVRLIYAKLEAALARQNELLKTFIEILECIEVLEESICNEECGVKGYLYGLAEDFSREGDASVRCDIEKSCDENIEPKPVLPLNCDRVYVFTGRQREMAEDEKDNIKGELERICREYEALASCERSLREAVESSREAQECK